MGRMAAYLRAQQAEDGSWCALWFGHQEAEGGRNPVIGTARVVDALRKAQVPGLDDVVAKGMAWLRQRQRDDGAWGMWRDATVEETALAVIALEGDVEAVRRGREWLCAQGMDGVSRPAPVGLYFALLWYHEKMYPLVWSLEALSKG